MTTPPDVDVHGGPTDPTQLDSWLVWLETRNPHRIELGLGRVHAVWDGLKGQGYEAPKVVTVAGTNGKGSSVALLEAILLAEGYRVGAYTSPHLIDFTERVRIGGVDIHPDGLVAAFTVLHAQPGSETLTYFEWATLAAFIAFSIAVLDVWILEVGLGGRLDAVNILDADLALITGIGLDHQAILGPDRPSIAREKAGILRSGQPAVYTDLSPEPMIPEVAEAVGADLWVSDRDFSLLPGSEGWVLKLPMQPDGQVWPNPALKGRHQIHNAAGVVALMRHPRNPLSVSDASIRLGLETAVNIGRFERWSYQGRLIILDVAHNQESVRALIDNLMTIQDKNDTVRRVAIFSALEDKPIEAMVSIAGSYFDTWYFAPLTGMRAASARRLRDALATVGGAGVVNEMGIVPAYNQALADSAPGVQIVIFGSFLTVSAIRPELIRAGAHLV